jgi:hypothetical protein
MFETTTKEIRHREHPETWKLQARTWKPDATPEQIGNALAGNSAPALHAAGNWGARRKSFADSACRRRWDHAGRRSSPRRSPTAA